MRSLWLKNIKTNEIWDLLPKNPYLTFGGCLYGGIKGFGYANIIKQNQIEADYIPASTQSTSVAISGMLYFINDIHVENFQKFIGDFREQFLLYYSPDGNIEPHDQLNSTWYKPVIIKTFDKSEKELSGHYEVMMTLTPQSDVWKRDVNIQIVGGELANEPLVYPYVYDYMLDDNNLTAIQFTNEGRKVGCKIQITNNTSDVIGSDTDGITWFNDATVGMQQAKFLLYLRPGESLVVDSNPLSYSAYVLHTTGVTEEIISLQEPSWDYINFIEIQNGFNKIVFNLDTKAGIDISLTYYEQREIV